VVAQRIPFFPQFFFSLFVLLLITFAFFFRVFSDFANASNISMTEAFVKAEKILKKKRSEHGYTFN